MGRAAKTIAAGIPAFAYMFTVGSIGFWLPLYAQEALGYTHSQLEYLATVYFATLALGSLASGAITDRTGRPWLVASAGLAVNTATIILMYVVESFPAMLAVRAVQGLGLSTAIPVALGSLSLLAGESTGVGLTSLFMSAGMALGSLAGGILVAGPGYWALFASAAVVSALGAVASLAIRIGPPRGPPPSILEALRHVRGPVLVVLAGIFLRQLFATGVYAILAVLLRSVLGLGLLATTAALTVNPLVQGALSMAIASAVRRLAGEAYALGIALTSAVFIMLAESAGRSLLAFAAMAVQGVGFALVNIAGNYIVITGLPRSVRYTASSLFSLFFNLGWIAGTGLAGLALARMEPLAYVRLSAWLLLSLSAAVYALLRTSLAHSRAPLPSRHA